MGCTIVYSMFTYVTLFECSVFQLLHIDDFNVFSCNKIKMIRLFLGSALQDEIQRIQQDKAEEHAVVPGFLLRGFPAHRGEFFPQQDGYYGE